MFDSIKKDLIFQYQYGGMTIKLILINIGFFLAIMLFRLVLFIGNAGELPGFYYTIVDGLSLSNEWRYIILRPWTWITHMFMHLGLLHILFNMLYLMWFGRILENLLGPRKIINIYIIAGLCGALFFFGFSKLLYTGEVFAFGASAAVMGIAVAAATMVPDHEMRLLFIGNVKLKFLVLALVLLDLIMIPSMSNSGGHVAHLGGAFMGFLYIKLLYNGIDLGDIKWKPKVKKRPSFKVMVNKEKMMDLKKTKERSLTEQQRIDAVLEKIKEEGYEKLSQEEKDFLFEVSKK
ncbi:rhomboid family protein [Membranihabitans marinus]|uniref:rhomboid family protein n=1 Tax=Membranihabitans marinus TaxID=1227546 RepID=UPI001F25F824|nr:rhomboid family intramembrane serine protease [Membranihabitans marinus]